MQRHEAFRTSFFLQGNEVMQRIEKGVTLPSERISLVAKTDEAMNDEVQRCIRSFVKPFNLSEAPLARILIIDINETECILVYDLHHIIADEKSVDIFTSELLRLYDGHILRPLEFQYKDYSEWHNKLLKSPKIDAQRDYWLEVYWDNRKIPILNMPYDYVRPSKQDYSGAKFRYTILPELSEQLMNLAHAENTTLFVVLLALWNVLLGKYSEQDDIIIGSPVEGRRQTGLDSVIGLFINMLALRNRPCGNLSFLDFLETVKSSTYNAFENQEYPFEELLNHLNLDKDLSREALFSVVFVLHNMYGKTFYSNSIEYSNYLFDTKTTKMDLTINAVEIDNSIALELEYATKLYTEASICKLVMHFVTLAQEVCKEPNKALKEYTMISKDEIMQIEQFNSTANSYQHFNTLQEVFERQTAGTPDSIALVHGESSYTYAQVNSMANRLAVILRDKGVQPDTIIPIYMIRSEWLMVSILAVLKAGGAYLPINPAWPTERVKYILKDCRAKLLLMDDCFQDGFLESPSAIEYILTSNIQKDYTCTQNLPMINRPQDMLYVMYTSGSTGMPKGVVLNHQSVNNTLEWLTTKYSFEADDYILQKTIHSFDVSVLELLAWFYNGSTLVMLKADEEKEPQAIIDTVIEWRVRILHFVPSALDLFLDYLEYTNRESSLIMLRYIFACGEILLPQTVEKFNRLLAVNGTKLINLYGPTETSIAVTAYDCGEKANHKTIPIGKPIWNCQIQIILANGNRAPIGIPGEVCIYGDTLARGYLNEPVMTQKKFSPSSSGRCYHTGDYARWLPNGNIEFIGRYDEQVKVRGFRIELGEIESIAMRHPALQKAVAVADEKYGICLYYIADNTVETSTLQQFMSDSLPAYMIPAVFIKTEQIYYNSNGKCDRKQLIKMNGGIAHPHFQTDQQRTELEQIIICIWEEVLNIEVIQVTDNFFSIGGNSLNTIHVEMRMKNKGLICSAQDIFQYQTVRELAKYIESSSCVLNQEITTGGQANPAADCEDKIEIFNRLRYRSCFYNALFSALSPLPFGVLPVLANDVIVSSYTETLGLQITYIEDRPLQEVMSKYGVDLTVLEVVNDTIASIHSAIDKECLVIIAVDCFYESIRKDTYHKLHWPHYLLVYGYDDTRQVCKIIEHPHKDSLAYEKKELSYLELKQAHDGYLSRYKQAVEPIFVEVYSGKMMKDKYSLMTLKRDYLSHMTSHLDVLKQVPGQFNQYIMSVISVLSGTAVVNEQMIASVNEIIEVHQVELYKWAYFFSDEYKERRITLEAVLTLWKRSREYMVKMLYGGSKTKLRDSLFCCLRELMQAEVEFYNWVQILAERENC